jgi:hypothetical protein
MTEGSDWFGLDSKKPTDSYVAVFVPSKTRDLEDIDHYVWRRNTVQILSELFGGATSVSGYGGWLDEEDSPTIKEEEVSIVVSYISREKWNQENGLKLKKYLSRMGRETEQGSIGIVVEGQFIEFEAKNYEQ